MENQSTVTTEIDITNTDAENNESTNNKRKAIKQSGFLYKLGKASDKTISIFACIAIGLVLAEPAFMFFYSFHSRSIDVYMMEAVYIINGWVFPLASVVTFIIYILVLLRIRNENKGLVYHLKKNPLFFIFALVVLFMFISQIYNMNHGLDAGFTDTPDWIRNESFDMQYSYFMVLLFAGSQVRIRKHKQFLLRSQLIISMMVVGSGFKIWLSDFLSFLITSDEFEKGFMAFFTNLNYYGYYLSVCVPLAGAMFVHEKNKVWKIIALISFAANIVALSLNTTRGAWLACAMGVLFIIIATFIIEKKVNKWSLLLIPIFAITLYIPAHTQGTFEENFTSIGSDAVKVITNAEGVENAGTDRIKLWLAGLDVVWDNPIFGIGFEGVYVREYVGAPYMTRPHNEFIQHAMFYGIPMAVMYICGCFGIFLRALRKKKHLDGVTFSSLAATFGYLVSSFFGLTVHSTAMFLFVFMGMGYVRVPEASQNDEELLVQAESGD